MKKKKKQSTTLAVRLQLVWGLRHASIVTREDAGGWISLIRAVISVSAWLGGYANTHRVDSLTTVWQHNYSCNKHTHFIKLFYRTFGTACQFLSRIKIIRLQKRQIWFLFFCARYWFSWSCGRMAVCPFVVPTGFLLWICEWELKGCIMETHTEPGWEACCE